MFVVIKRRFRALREKLLCIYIFTFKSFDEGFDMKEKIKPLLTEGGFDSKRARTMDIDDFLA